MPCEKENSAAHILTVTAWLIMLACMSSAIMQVLRKVAVALHSNASWMLSHHLS